MSPFLFLLFFSSREVPQSMPFVAHFQKRFAPIPLLPLPSFQGKFKVFFSEVGVGRVVKCFFINKRDFKKPRQLPTRGLTWS
jgi:hypothetical protein